MFMLKARSRVVDVPGVVWALTRPLFIVAVMIVAVMLALPVTAGVVYAQGTPTVPTIESVAVTSDPGEDGGYAIDDEIQVGLTFSEAVTVTGAPQLNLDVGGRTRTAEYSGGTTSTTRTTQPPEADQGVLSARPRPSPVHAKALRAAEPMKREDFEFTWRT